MAQKIFLYALSTCIHCRHAKEFLDDNNVPYDFVYVDKLVGEERQQTVAKMKEYNPRASFPTIVINDGEQVVVGFIKPKLEEALGL